MVEPVLIEKRQILENITRINFFILFQWTAAKSFIVTGNECKNPNKKPLHPPKNHTSCLINN